MYIKVFACITVWPSKHLMSKIACLLYFIEINYLSKIACLLYFIEINYLSMFKLISTKYNYVFNAYWLQNKILEVFKR